MKFLSSFSILLSLVAALSTMDAVAAQSRKLRKDGGHDGRRKLTKVSKCHKSAKDGCIGFNLQFPVEQRNNNYFGVSYGYGGNGESLSYPGDDPGQSAVGTVWFARGNLGKLMGEEETEVLDFTDRNFFFRQECTVLEGVITEDLTDFPDVTDGQFRTPPNYVGKVPLKCELYLEAGKGDSGFEDLPDSIHLKGYTKGTANVFKAEPNFAQEELRKVDDFWATVTGGTGRWAGAVGVAQVFSGGFPNDPVKIPREQWLIDLYAVASKEYQDLFNVAELPPVFNFNLPEDIP